MPDSVRVTGGRDAAAGLGDKDIPSVQQKIFVTFHL